MTFAHTPYDGSKQPFTIALEPLGARDWIEVDGHLVRDLAEKERLLATRRDRVAREEPATREAGVEVLAMLAKHLPEKFPETYAQEGAAMRVLPAGRAVPLDGDETPLVTAARLVQEDLCLMRRDERAWRLAAAVLCFPAGWSLADKAGADLSAIHAPVPGFAGRMENVVARIFDNLRPGAPLLRFNWSIYGDADLHRPPDAAAARFRQDDPARAHVRVERQTLTRLPVSGDILFTIRTHVDPVAALASHPRGRGLAAGLRAQLLALTPDQTSYKGLASARDELARTLDDIANGR